MSSFSGSRTLIFNLVLSFFMMLPTHKSVFISLLQKNFYLCSNLYINILLSKERCKIMGDSSAVLRWIHDGIGNPTTARTFYWQLKFHYYGQQYHRWVSNGIMTRYRWDVILFKPNSTPCEIEQRARDLQFP